MSSKIRTVELFAGVGGFRLGLESLGVKKGLAFEVVWSNQWEPSTKRQHASEVYVDRFGSKHHSNQDLNEVPTAEIPDHDLLVGGFPCQDYSVASTLNNSKGLIGKKGVLWWQIHRILKEKQNKPKLLLLENVDRLLASPAQQRGKDMAVMLKSLSDLGYSAEWRVINAAEHGMPQRRRRIFIVGYLANSGLGPTQFNETDRIEGILAEAFPEESLSQYDSFKLGKTLVSITRNFNKKGAKSPFKNAGQMIDGKVVTAKCTYKIPVGGTTLGDILEEDSQVPEEFFIPKTDIAKWEYLKGAKSEKRVNSKTGHEYHYSEGSMTFPDRRDAPSRTIITGEGGKSPSRFKHVVECTDGRYRRLTPLELERLNMFPDNHTAGMSPAKRAFFMGNALVVGVISQIGHEILSKWKK